MTFPRFIKLILYAISGSVLTMLATVTIAGAAPRDLAPIPDDVIQKVLAHAAAPRDQLAEKLDRHLSEVGDLVRLTEAESNQSEILPEQRARYDAKLNELKVVREESRSRLSEIRRQLIDHGLSDKVKKWDAFSKQVEERFDRVEGALKDIVGARGPKERARSIEKTKEILRELHENVRNREAAPSTLPFPSQSYGEPAGPPTQPESETTPQYVSQNRPPITSYYAFAGSTLLAAAPPATPPEAQSCGYDPGVDLGEDGQEIIITPEISALAEKLEYSPIKIYKYVYDSIAYEPYYGSLKGAQGTLVSGAGNATDQASLLIALLRKSNIPARYVRGQIIIDDKTPMGKDGRAPRWVGAKTYQAAAAILSSGLIPAGTSSLNGQMRGIYLDHVWVEACVPYGHYRGARIDNLGTRWIPLDPSFKDKTYQTGIATNVNFDYSGYLAVRTDQLPHEKFAEQVESAVKGIDSNNSLQDVPYIGRQKPLKIDILPSSLPYNVTKFTNWSSTGTPETALLPDTHRYKLTVRVTKEGADLLSSVFTYPNAALKRISLSYKPADAGSQLLWNQWGGDLQALPGGGTVIVKPVLRLEGIEQGSATGTLTLGNANTLIMKVSLDEYTLTAPKCINDSGSSVSPDPDLHCVNKTVYADINAGAYLALQANAFQTSDRLLAERAAKLIDAVRTDPAEPTPARIDAYEATVGEFLHLSLLKYLRYSSDSTRQIGELSGVSALRGNDLGLTSSGLKVSYLFDLPFTIAKGGFYIDFKGGIILPAKLDSTATTLTASRAETWPTFKLASYAGSAFEHYIWQENARTDAVSTIRGMQYTAEHGTPLVTFSSANIANFNSLMDPSMLPYKAQITAYVSVGATVTVPKSAISYTEPGQPQSWNGGVYMAENQGEGYISAIISGGLGGGYALLYPKPFSSIFSISPDLPRLAIDRTFSEPLNSTTMSNGLNQWMFFSGDPVNMATGNMYHVERDIVLKGQGGLPLIFERSYNSRAPQNGPLGFGWTHSFNHYLTFYGVEDGKAKVGWTDGTGGEKFFTAIPGTGGGIAVNTTLANTAGVFSSFRREADGSYTIREKNGLSYTFENVAGTVGQKAKLLAIRDRNNNALTMGYNGGNLTTVTDGAQRSLNFTVVNGRITEAKDWTGRSHTYDYDATGNLWKHRTPLAVAGTQNPVVYEYHGSTDGPRLNHALKRITLPRGNAMTYEYYQNGRLFRHYNSKGETSTFTYNEFRRETIHVDERGNTRRAFFDQYGNPTMIVEGNGAEHLYTYETSDPSRVHNRASHRDPRGLFTRYQYDGGGNLTGITRPSNSTIEFSHHTPFSRPGKVKDANGVYTLYRYDDRGNLLQEIKLKKGIGANIDPATYIPAATDIVAWTVSSYDPFGNLQTTRQVRDFAAQITNANARTGPTIEYNYNDTANNIQGVNAVSITRRGDKDGDGIISDSEYDSATLAYDSLGRTTAGLTADWYPTEIHYDATDRIIKATDANGYLRDYRYDENGNPIEEQLVVVTDGLPRLHDAKSAGYNDADRKETATDAGGFLTTYRYDTAGNLESITNPDNYTLSFEYDGANRLTWAYDQENNAVTRTLDPNGNPRTVSDPNGNAVTYEYYDASRDGRLKRVNQPKIQADAQGRAEEYDYDANGNATVSTTIGADGTTRVTLTQYDELNRPTRVVGPLLTDPLLGTVRPVTTYAYDTMGNLETVKAGHTTDTTGANPAADILATLATYTSDDFGHRLSETDPLGKSWRYEYDRHGNVTKTTDANGQITRNSWGYGHQLLSRTNDSGSVTYARYTRNPLGQVTKAESPEVTYSYTYDDAHRLESVTDSRGNKTLTYDWSPGGLLSWLSDSDGNRTDYDYDPAGRLAGIWAANLDYVTFHYDAGGRLTEKWFPNGITARYDYNPDNSLKQVVNRTAESTIVSRHDYTYDPFGNRSLHTEQIGTVTTPYRYTYDELNRLTEVRNNTTGALMAGYSYDPLNNRLTSTDGVTTRHYLHDPVDRTRLKEIRDGSPTGALLASYQYDDNGNVTTKTEGATSTPLVWDALNRLKQAGAESYGYDDQGRRIRKTTGTGATNYLYNGPDIHGEYAGWTDPTAIYTHGPATDDPLIRATDASATYYHQDGLGSVVAVTDPTKAITGTSRYDAWGNIIAATGAIPQFGYTGREPDATGLIYYRARYYDPASGRFVSRDPIGMLAGINPYAYVQNSPVNFTDPEGLLPRGSVQVADNSGYASSGSDASQGFIRTLERFSKIFPEDAPVTTISKAFGGLAAYGYGLLTGDQALVDLAVQGMAENRSNNLNAFYLLSTMGRGGAKGGVSTSTTSVGNSASNAADAMRLNKSLASQAQMSEVGEIMAGPGGRVPFRDAGRIASQYGGNPADWVKRTSTSYTARDGVKFETHWVENIKTGQRVEFKTKFPGGN